jgi:hypothetical protein
MTQPKNAPVSPAYLGGALIGAVMFLTVFIGGANAGNCPCSNSAEATSVEAHHKADEKSEVEV